MKVPDSQGARGHTATLAKSMNNFTKPRRRNHEQSMERERKIIVRFSHQKEGRLNKAILFLFSVPIKREK
jgi:hypothetical protein